ncbi:MAG: hypothetical protein U0792_22510 [Gemmataceae bacterium]
MDGIREMLSAVRDAGLLNGNFRALLHVAIGRKVTRPDGSTLSTGVTWRALATELKALRFDQELVREYGADPDALTARDRERFWYAAIAVSRVDSAEATAEADRFALKLKSLGYIVGPSPSAPPPAAPKAKPAEAKPKEKEKPKEPEKDDKAAKKKKK